MIFYNSHLALEPENGESIQILHYEHGQKYEPHYDYFHDKANQELGGHRVATVLMYLSNVERGGETVFPHAEVRKLNDAVILKYVTMAPKVLLSMSIIDYVSFIYCRESCLNQRVMTFLIVLKMVIQVLHCFHKHFIFFSLSTFIS